MADADAVASANLSRYDALLRISKTLCGHKTMAELFEVLADQLHAMSRSTSHHGLCGSGAGGQATRTGVRFNLKHLNAGDLPELVRPMPGEMARTET